MHIDISSKPLAIGIGSILVIAPFAIWAALYIATRKRNIHPKSLLPWMLRLRWVVYSCALLLYVGGFIIGHSRWLFYGTAMLACSSGLALSETWLKKQTAPSRSAV
ncbi:hypothetical protein HDF16_005659 [Granulicella aggregans]|uniref:Uncharacterized protein n=1 Tax=Granulicella aggregans TaxID=474949 RepID=A0A7W7ZJA8_9BACT|nr:hypothetical protein [Granulicella aggregans]